MQGQTRHAWKTFFPLTPTTLIPVLRPLIIWPSVDLRILPPQSILAPDEDRVVTRLKPTQTGILLLFN